MTTTEDLLRAGLAETRPGVFTKGDNAATHLRSAAVRDAGHSDLSHEPAGQTAVLERDPGNGALGKVSVQKAVGRRFLIRVTSIRKNLLDEDNLCEKYHVDLCRYSGLIPGDSPATTKIEVCQQKAEPGAAEETRIEIFER
jgi:hypothetical protein